MSPASWEGNATTHLPLSFDYNICYRKSTIISKPPIITILSSMTHRVQCSLFVRTLYFVSNLSHFAGNYLRYIDKGNRSKMKHCQCQISKADLCLARVELPGVLRYAYQLWDDLICFSVTKWVTIGFCYSLQLIFLAEVGSGHPFAADTDGFIGHNLGHIFLENEPEYI